MRSVFPVVRIVAAVAAALAIYRLSIMPWHCNRVIRDVRMRTLSLSSLPEESALEVARENLARLDTAKGGCWTTVNLHLLRAVNAHALHRDAESITYLDDALAVDQRPEIYFDRALTRLSMGDVQAAVSDFVVAVRFNPNLAEDISGPLRDRVRSEAAQAK